MIAALIEASLFCDLPENRSELARMLARPRYFDVDKKLLSLGLAVPFKFGHGRSPVKDFVIYDALKVGAPTRAAGKWVFDLMRNLGGNGSNPALRVEIIPKVFREDIFNEAVELVESSNGGNRAPHFSAGANKGTGMELGIRPVKLTPQNLVPANERFQSLAAPWSLSARNNPQETSTALCA